MFEPYIPGPSGGRRFGAMSTSCITVPMVGPDDDFEARKAGFGL